MNRQIGMPEGLTLQLVEQLTPFPWGWLVPAGTTVLVTAIALTASRHLAKRRRNTGEAYRTVAEDALLIAVGYPMALCPLLILFLQQWVFIPAFFLIGCIYWHGTLVAPSIAAWGLLQEGVAGSQSSRKGALALLGAWLVLGPFVFCYSALYEPYRVVEERYEVSIPGNFEPFRLVHLSDIQSDVLTRRERELPGQVNALSPDVIVLTGDYFNGLWYSHRPGYRAAAHVLSRLEAPLGVYGVTGHMDTMEGHERLFELTGTTLLENESVLLEPGGQAVELVGIDCKSPQIDESFRDTGPDLPQIVIHHTPDIAPELAGRRLDLLLTGHTHGGQFVVPGFGAIIALTTLGREYASGLFDYEDMRLYVNRGIGMEGIFAPPFRIFCPPEIAVFDIQPQTPPSGADPS